jgi:two-component system phosphate regulon response regulator PhoB
MTGKQILIVEDEKPIRDMIAFGLRRAGFDVREAEDCTMRARALRTGDQTCCLVDWMLPDQSGLELTRALKRHKDTQDMPVIMLTARADEHDKVVGLEGGADDYVTKPFSPRELLARINAVLRRSSVGGSGESLEAGGLALDAAGHRVTCGADTVALGPDRSTGCYSSSWSIRKRVYTRSQLLDRVWGGNVYVEERTVDVHIRRLRKALEPHGQEQLIQTVRGSGYRFSTRPE